MAKRPWIPTPRDVQREVQREVQQAVHDVQHAMHEVQSAARRVLHVAEGERARLSTLLSPIAGSAGLPPQSPTVTFHEISLRSVLLFGSIWWAALWGLVGLIVAYSVMQTELDIERAALIVVMYPLAGVILFTPLTIGTAAIYDVVARRFGGFAVTLTELHPDEEARGELDVTVRRVRLRSAVVFGAIWWVALWTTIGLIVTLLEISGMNRNRFGMYAFFYLPVVYGGVFTGTSALLAGLYNVVANRWRGFVFGLSELAPVEPGRNDVRVTVHRVDLRSILMFGSAFWFMMLFILGVTVSILAAVKVIQVPFGVWTGAFTLALVIPLTLLCAALTLIYNGVAQSYGGIALTLSVPPEFITGGSMRAMPERDAVPPPSGPAPPPL